MSKVRFNLNLFQSMVRLDLGRLIQADVGTLPDADTLLNEGASPLRYYARRQLDALTKKNVDAPGSTALSRKAAALQKFEEAEYACCLYNTRSGVREYSTLVAQVIGDAQCLARDILGPLDTRAFRAVFAEARYGSGMTFGDTSKTDTSLAVKLTGKQTVTKDLIQYLPFFAFENPLWWGLLDKENVSIVRGNRVTTVPKTAETDRTIAIEPSLNMLCQRGVDIYMRRRLLRYGVDLSDQTRGWPLAARGSLDGSYATIDLSSASDTLSTRVVMEFLDREWYVFLDDIRSKEYTTDKGKSWRTYQKFSSMGNSFTFPLETLIFFSVASVCTRYTSPRSQCIVYGDDIVVPRAAYALCSEVLQVLGFTPNPSKSYAVGNFRETCGHDYYCGVDVRPIYVRSNPRTEVEVYNLFNRFLNNRQGVSFENTLEYLFSLVERPLFQPRYYAPSVTFHGWEPHLSVIYDGGFMVPESFAKNRVKSFWHDGFQAKCYQFLVWSTRRAKLRDPKEDILVFLSCYTGSHVAYDDGRVFYAPRRATVTRWYDGGKWPDRKSVV